MQRKDCTTFRKRDSATMQKHAVNTAMHIIVVGIAITLNFCNHDKVQELFNESSFKYEYTLE